MFRVQVDEQKLLEQLASVEDIETVLFDGKPTEVTYQVETEHGPTKFKVVLPPAPTAMESAKQLAEFDWLEGAHKSESEMHTSRSFKKVFTGQQVARGVLRQHGYSFKKSQEAK